MKTFAPLVWDINTCQSELDRFRQLLVDQEALSEARDILPLFQSCLHLAACLGDRYAPRSTCDLIAFEYDLFGDFSCDLVVGDAHRKSYVFVEFEGAELDSLFRRQGKKATREWAPAFAHGFCQVVDWFTKVHDQEKTDDFERRFGARAIEYTGVLIIGRDQHLEPGERRRLEWWRSHVVVASTQIVCVTYDELLQELSSTLARYQRLPAKRRRKS